jgi:ribosomal protein S8
MYNYMDDGGFISELEAVHKQKFTINDFESIIFELPLNEKNGLIHHIKSVSQKYIDLKKYVEETIQENKSKPKAMVFIKRDNGSVFLVKMVDFDLIGKIK